MLGDLANRDITQCYSNHSEICLSVAVCVCVLLVIFISYFFALSLWWAASLFISELAINPGDLFSHFVLIKFRLLLMWLINIRHQTDSSSARCFWAFWLVESDRFAFLSFSLSLSLFFLRVALLITIQMMAHHMLCNYIIHLCECVCACTYMAAAAAYVLCVLCTHICVQFIPLYWPKTEERILWLTK